MSGLSTTNKASDIILSNGELDAESNSTTGGGVVLSDIGHSTGKWYFEAERRQKYSANDAFGVGVHAGAGSLTVYLGSDMDGWAVWDNTASLMTYYNAVGTNSQSGDVAVYQRLRVAVDLTAGKLWFAYPVSGWIGGGDPESGVSPTYTFTPSGMYYAALCPRRGHGSTASDRNRVRYHATPDKWCAPAPVGYMAWDSTHQVSGTVLSDAGAPAARTIRAYLRSSGLLVAAVVSDAGSGEWMIDTPYTGEHILTALDDTAGDSYNALIFDRVTPV